MNKTIHRYYNMTMLEDGRILLSMGDGCADTVLTQSGSPPDLKIDAIHIQGVELEDYEQADLFFNMGAKNPYAELVIWRDEE